MEFSGSNLLSFLPHSENMNGNRLLTNIDLEPLEVFTDQFIFGFFCVIFVIEVDEGEGTLNGNNVSCHGWRRKIYAEMETVGDGPRGQMMGSTGCRRREDPNGRLGSNHEGVVLLKVLLN